jgi:hypothetical protein
MLRAAYASKNSDIKHASYLKMRTLIPSRLHLEKHPTEEMEALGAYKIPVSLMPFMQHLNGS